MKTNYNSATMLASLKGEVEVGYVVLISDMIGVCRSFLVDVREQLEGHELGNYNNRSKQLRGSLAAYIYRNGNVIWADEGENGMESRKVITEQVILTPSGFNVVGIASKEYASHVESKGYNVMTNQSDKFIVDLSFAFAKLGKGEIGRIHIMSPTKAITRVNYGNL